MLAMRGRSSEPGWCRSTACRFAPIYLAALGPRMLALAGRIADGVILNLMSPAQAGEAVATVRSAEKAAGRDPSAVEIACVVRCCLSDDADAAAAATRAVVPRYVLPANHARCRPPVQL
jgi:5,10-methylenetetrahydromethanopterin reductase